MKIPPTFTPRTLLSNFGPWIVYGLLAAAGFPGWAYVGGLAASLVLAAFRRQIVSLKVMDAVSLLFFSSGAIVTLILHSSLFLRDGSLFLWSALALVAWGSLLAAAPFTAEYARESVPESVWSSPGFRRVNVAVTAAWGVVFAVNALVAAALSLIPGWPLEHLRFWLNAVPSAGTLFGIVFTNRFPQWASRQEAGEALP